MSSLVYNIYNTADRILTQTSLPNSTREALLLALGLQLAGLEIGLVELRDMSTGQRTVLWTCDESDGHFLPLVNAIANIK